VDAGDTDGYWVEPADAETDGQALDDGYTVERDLLYMRRDLPVDEPVTVDTRAFRPGQDEAAWLEVNNRAFRWHPDQSDQTVDRLRAKMAEPWFEPEGFLLHEVDGRLAGFCWTKVHDGSDGPSGEIYVIGVDPAFTGRGLGRALTVAGLDHLYRVHHTPVGVLYVEADNETAIGVYRRLGFDVVRHRRRYVRS
jgi:mycothiol synthase